MAATVTGEIVDSQTSKPVAARLYIQGPASNWWHAASQSEQGFAVPYAKTNRINPHSVEVHTTLSADPFRAELPEGTYTFTIERGKEYFPLTQTVEIKDKPVQLRLPLKRWINMAERGWFSGETHIHRTTDQVAGIVLAEDLNVAFPLTFWITRGCEAPGTSDRNLAGGVLNSLIHADDTHVVWPRNTEYEIFTMGSKDHTLGALFLLNHQSVFTNGVPPWSPIAKQALAEGALLDMDKLDWAFSLMLPPVTGANLYELANNHMWRTEFAFTKYVSQAPPYLHPPYGAREGTERDWTLYTFGMYYTLLNAGFRSAPTAGTASGVHPVPAGFSRVYVHLPEGFTYQRWLEGVRAGRSFVTTGPMLFATVNGMQPGALFTGNPSGTEYRVQGSIISEQSLSFIEVLLNGKVQSTIMPQNHKTEQGASESKLDVSLTSKESGWIAVRCWEDRPGGRFRWAHTAPWHIQVPGKPLLARQEEKDFLVERMKFEIARSRDVLSPEAMEENHRALAAYEALKVRDDSGDIARSARPPKNDKELRYWLENMIWHHGFSAQEIRASTGFTLDEIEAAQKRHSVFPTNRPSDLSSSGLRVLPYPGGRHPRTGFPDGALRPQRDTKFSVFTPWNERSYVVVDVPEAIWSGLGLTYLAHDHVETIWTKDNILLDPLEWTRLPDGTLEFERMLPNGIAFGTKVFPGLTEVRMEAWLRNGTSSLLSGLRLQNCVMLKAAKGFHEQTAQNKVLRAPYAACCSADGKRWIITAWTPLDAVWQNPPVPCMHSNPKLPDCPPGQTVRARGWLSFYEGADLDAEINRLEQTGWPPRIK